MAHCANCGASAPYGRIRCLACGKPLVFADPGEGAGWAADAKAAYRDDRFEPRACDRCGKEYRGPAVYCSLECAVADA